MLYRILFSLLFSYSCSMGVAEYYYLILAFHICGVLDDSMAFNGARACAKLPSCCKSYPQSISREKNFGHLKKKEMI